MDGLHLHQSDLSLRSGFREIIETRVKCGHSRRSAAIYPRGEIKSLERAAYSHINTARIN